MQHLIPFAFDSHAVRTLMIDNRPWFVGKDVALALGYANSTDAIKRHCDGVAKRYPISDSLGRTQEVRLINEPDVFRLIISSHLPEAKRFERWVFGEVLPALRQNGHYGSLPVNAQRSTLADTSALLALIAAIRREPNAEVQTLLHAKLAHYCQQHDLPLPTLTDMASVHWSDPAPAQAFWKAIRLIETRTGKRMNHALHADQVAYNLPEIRALAKAHGQSLPSTRELGRSLRGQPGFIDYRTIRSARDNRTVHCWLFKAGKARSVDRND